ncbi:unnamed protein product, partial [Medioppia subpectinata]
PAQLAIIRFVGIFVLTIPVVVWYGVNPFGPKEVRHILVLRAITGTTALFLRFYAFRYLTLADASEPCGILQTVIVVLTLVGLSLTTRLVLIFVPKSEPISVLNSTQIPMNSTHNYHKFSAEIESNNYLYGIIAALSSTIFTAAAEKAGPVSVVRAATDILLRGIMSIKIDTNYNKKNIPHIIIRGDPYTRGLSYGQQMKKKIVKNLHFYKDRYQLLDWTQVEQFMNKNYVKALKKYFPSGLQEMRGIAAGADVSLEDIIALNARYELMRWNRELIKKSNQSMNGVPTQKQVILPQLPHECTSGVCLSKATQSGDVLMGQNWDQNKRMLADDMILVLEVHPDPSENKVPLIMLTEVGQLGRSGINANGLGITGMSLFSSDDLFGEDSGSGYIPMGLFRRMFLEAPNFPVGLKSLIDAPRHVSINMTVASAEGEAFNIEMTPKHYFVSYPPFDTDIITHCNLFKSDAFFANGSVRDTYICGSSLIRDQQMQRELRNKWGTIDEKSFTDCFKNHLCFPDSLCAHIPEKGREYLSTNPNLCTIANIVMNLTTKRLRETIQHIIIRGDPYTRGHSYGQQLKEKIVKNINYYKELYHLLDWRQVEQFMNKNYVKALNKYFPSGLQEMRGIATGADVSLEDIILLNARYELMKWNRQLIKKNREQLTNVPKDKQIDLPPAPHECTSAVCLSKATQTGDVLMGQNWDQHKRMLADDMLLLLEVYPDSSENKVPLIMLTEVGQLGRSGITGMSIFSSDDVFGKDSGSGYIPISLLRRMFLEAPTFPVAIRRLLIAPRHVSVNMTVASAEGEAFNIEMTPKHYFVSYPPFDTGIITHSNLFKSDAFFANGSVKDTYNCSSSLIRDRQMQRELLKRLGTIDEKSFTDCFKNHLCFPDSLCAHIPEKGREDMSTTPNFCTIANIVMNLTTKRLRLLYKS